MEVMATGAVLVAALLPFGPFVIDGRLAKEDEAIQAASTLAISSARCYP